MRQASTPLVDLQTTIAMMEPGTRRAQGFGLSSARRQYGRVVLRGNTFERFLNLIDRLRQVCTAERLEQMDGFCNGKLSWLRLFRHDAGNYIEVRALRLMRRLRE